MSDNVQSAMFEVLKSVQSSIARLEQTVTRIDQRGIEHDRRLTELERGQTELKELARKQRRDVAGIIVMMKSVAGDFDERVSAVERRLDAVEERLPS